MRLSLKLSLLLAAASAGPLLLQAFVTTPRGSRALRSQVHDMHSQMVQALASEVERALGEKLQALTLASGALRLAEFTAPERVQALRLIYKQTANAGVVGLFDERGNPVVDPVYFARPNEVGMRGQEAVDEAGLQRYAQNVPLQTALEAGYAVGPVYITPDADGRAIPRVVAAQRVPGAGGKSWVLGVELSLRPQVDRFAAFGVGQTGQAFLVDAQGATVAHADPQKIAERADLSAHPMLKGGDAKVIGASAPVRLLGWTAVISQDVDEALAPIRSQVRWVAVWCGVGLLGAFALGFTAVRSVTRPVGKLRDAAARVAAGSLDVQTNLKGRDELAQLGAAFNAMVKGLRERDRLKDSLSRYLSDELADKILKDDRPLELGGELVRVTVMHLKIRGVAELSAQHPPAMVVELLNTYYALAVRVILKAGGNINKFMGDEVLAVFGAPKKVSGADGRAMGAALETRHLVQAFNEIRRTNKQPMASIAIGIATGEVVAGNVGTEERLDYTVVGEAVNAAQRLQEQAADYEIIISTSALQRVIGRFTVEPLPSRGGNPAFEPIRLVDWSERTRPKVEPTAATGTGRQ